MVAERQKNSDSVYLIKDNSNTKKIILNMPGKSRLRAASFIIHNAF